MSTLAQTDIDSRPDHTLWYAYPHYVDTCLRSPDFYVFSKINVNELVIYYMYTTTRYPQLPTV